MSCDVSEGTERLITAHSPTTPSLYLRHSSFSNPSVVSSTSQLILQPLFRFSYVTGSSLMSPGELTMYYGPLWTHLKLHSKHRRFLWNFSRGMFILQPFRHPPAHSPTFPSLHLRYSSFSNPSVVFPTSQLILQPFRCLTYITVHSPTPSFASPTSQALHLIHLASRPW